MSCHARTKLNKQCKLSAKANNYCHFHGGGFVDVVKRRVNALIEGPSRTSTSRLKDFANQNDHQIDKIFLGRKPIHSVVHQALDTLSLGGFSRKKKELNYDDVYHNYLLVQLKDGKTYKLEKNHVVEATDVSEEDKRNVISQVPTSGKTLTIKQMLDNAAKDDPAFYRYSGGSANCQKFTRDVITRNNLLPSEHSNVQVQDANQLLNQLPLGHVIPNIATGLAAVGDRLLTGDGFHRDLQLLQFN